MSVLPECEGPTADLPLGGYFATNAWVSKHAKTALAFQRAIEKAQAKAASDRALPAQGRLDVVLAAAGQHPDPRSRLSSRDASLSSAGA